jgi:hypothetical protein
MAQKSENNLYKYRSRNVLGDRDNSKTLEFH